MHGKRVKFHVFSRLFAHACAVFEKNLSANYKFFFTFPDQISAQTDNP